MTKSAKKDKPEVLLEHHLKSLKLPRYGTIILWNLTIVRPSCESTARWRPSAARSRPTTGRTC